MLLVVAIRVEERSQGRQPAVQKLVEVSLLSNDTEPQAHVAAAVIVEGGEGNYQGWVVSGRAALGLKSTPRGSGYYLLYREFVSCK